MLLTSKLNRLIILNIFISILAFILIFYKYAGESGGDLIIIVFNIFFGVLQLITLSYFIRKKENKYYLLIIILIGIQMFEVMLVSEYGLQINNFIIDYKK
jgi:hypothetical protein